MVTSENLQVGVVESEIFRQVVVQFQPVEVVAKQRQLPVAEVLKIVERVKEAMLTTAAVETKEQYQQRIRLSEQKAAARLTELYDLAIHAYRQSQGQQKIVRQVGNDAPVTSYRHSQGDPRYLNAAAQIAKLASKLPTTGLSGKAALDEAVDLAQKHKAAVAATENHPVGACSTSRGEQQVTSAALPITGDVKSTDEFISDILSRGGAHAKTQNSRPVQASGSPKPRPR